MPANSCIFTMELSKLLQRKGAFERATKSGLSLVTLGVFETGKDIWMRSITKGSEAKVRAKYTYVAALEEESLPNPYHLLPGCFMNVATPFAASTVAHFVAWCLPVIVHHSHLDRQFIPSKQQKHTTPTRVTRTLFVKKQQVVSPFDGLEVHIGHSKGSISINENGESIWIGNLTTKKWTKKTCNQKKHTMKNCMVQPLFTAIPTKKSLPNETRCLGTDGKRQTCSHHSQAAACNEGARP